MSFNYIYAVHSLQSIEWTHDSSFENEATSYKLYK